MVNNPGRGGGRIEHGDMCLGRWYVFEEFYVYVGFFVCILPKDVYVNTRDQPQISSILLFICLDLFSYVVIHLYVCLCL